MVRAKPARQRGVSTCGRGTLLWALSFFFAGQLIFNIVIDRWWPDARDPRHGPLFAAKLKRLRSRLAEHPDRPLVLMLGSSLTMNGFQSEYLNEVTAATAAPILAFNFGIPGAGTIKQAFLWKELRERGVRPNLLFLEISPRHLFDPGPGADAELEPPEVRMTDLAALGRYSRNRSNSLFSWLKERWLPASTCRLGIVKRLGNSWLPSRDSDPVLCLLDAAGWLAFPGRHSTEARRNALRQFHERLDRASPEFFQNYRIWPGARRALTELLESCRRDQIAVILVRMPEESTMRQWYPRNMEPQFQALVADFCRTCGGRFIDAHSWVADDQFADQAHLLPAGATLFTVRLANEGFAATCRANE